MTTPQPFATPTRRSPTAPAEEVEALRLQVQALAAQAVPRHSRAPRSLRDVAANRWTPTAVTALVAVLVPLLIAWVTRTSDDTARQARETAQELARAKATLELTRDELEALRGKLGVLRDDLGKAQTAGADRSNWEDVAFCALGVRAPSGCPEVELLPRPMRGSSAPPIQVRARAPPD